GEPRAHEIARSERGDRDDHERARGARTREPLVDPEDRDAARGASDLAWVDVDEERGSRAVRLELACEATARRAGAPHRERAIDAPGEVLGAQAAVRVERQARVVPRHAARVDAPAEERRGDLRDAPACGVQAQPEVVV